MSQRLPFLYQFNGLRFLAASYVIAFHYFSLPNSTLLNRFFKQGHISVPFFFLLSGFVLTYSYHSYDFSGIRNKVSYIKNRFIRLAPIYYMALFLSLPFIYLNFKNGIKYSFLETISYSLTHLTLIQNLFPGKSHLHFWNYHSWSLSVEMILYIVSPVVIINSVRTAVKSSFAKVFILGAFNTLVYFLFTNDFTLLSGYRITFAPLYIPTFYIGSLLANIYIKEREVLTSKYNFMLSMIFIISSLAIITSFLLPLPKSFYSAFNPFYTFGFSLIIIGSTSQNIFTKFLSLPLLVLLGDASYAMYIFQAPIKTFTQQFLSKVIGYQSSTGIIFCVCVFLSITIFSIIVTKYIDPKLRNSLKSLLSP
ncbi:MAG: acyltransferase [Oligoflexia bacterium]|nr:acyltransferase [Oligoflexia bacterium]